MSKGNAASTLKEVLELAIVQLETSNTMLDQHMAQKHWLTIKCMHAYTHLSLQEVCSYILNHTIIWTNASCMQTQIIGRINLAIKPKQSDCQIKFQIPYTVWFNHILGSLFKIVLFNQMIPMEKKYGMLLMRNQDLIPMNLKKFLHFQARLKIQHRKCYWSGCFCF